MRQKIYSTVLKVSADDDLRRLLTQAAADERTTISEIARRELRKALAERARTANGPRRAA